METVLDDFNERVIEIEEYLKLLELVAHPSAEIHIFGKRVKRASNTAIKTMKASCFLMLYNLVESSIRGSMARLYEKINNEQNGLQMFDQFVKKLWVKEKFKNLDPLSSNQINYKSLITEMVDEVLESSPIFFEPNNLHFGGNLDARKIRALFESHNIPTHTHYRALHGVELLTIKNKRNSLSHGSESFSECGQQYTVQSIIDIKKQTVVFLRGSLKNVQRYIENKKYAA